MSRNPCVLIELPASNPAPQALAYYGGMCAYYWLLATPVVGLVFGVYLYASTCIFGVHFDEAFSSLKVPDHKALTRMHVNR